MLGRLTNECEQKKAKTGNTVGVFSLAVARDFKREGSPDTDFFSCVAYGKTAENIAKFSRKGNRIAVSGRVENSKYKDKDSGKELTKTWIVVDGFDFCESKATSDSNMPLTEDTEEDTLPF